MYSYSLSYSIDIPTIWCISLGRLTLSGLFVLRVCHEIKGQLSINQGPNEKSQLSTMVLFEIRRFNLKLELPSAVGDQLSAKYQDIIGCYKSEC